MSIWHKWLAHANPKNIGNMVRKNVVDGLDLVEVEKEFVCEDCTLGKQTRLPFQTGRVRATKSGELIHSDVCGPMPETTHRGFRYFLTVIDDFSSYCVIVIYPQPERYGKYTNIVHSIPITTHHIK